MKILAIDCATERLAIAAIDDGSPPGIRPGPGAIARRETCRLEVLDAPGGPAASASVLPSALALLARMGWRFDQLDAIAFGRGPGGFTGLRTACAVAQGLAFGQAIPVVPVDSLAIVAEDARAQRLADGHPADTTWVLMDARMDEIYAGAYAPAADGGWNDVVAPALLTPGALAEAWRAAPPAVVAGSALAAFEGRLPTGDAARVEREHGRAAALGWLALVGFHRGDAVPADQALPVYLRDKVAQTTAEREAARAAKALKTETSP